MENFRRVRLNRLKVINRVKRTACTRFDGEVTYWAVEYGSSPGGLTTAEVPGELGWKQSSALADAGFFGYHRGRSGIGFNLKPSSARPAFPKDYSGPDGEYVCGFREIEARWQRETEVAREMKARRDEAKERRARREPIAKRLKTRARSIMKAADLPWETAVVRAYEVESDRLADSTSFTDVSMAFEGILSSIRRRAGVSVSVSAEGTPIGAVMGPGPLDWHHWTRALRWLSTPAPEWNLTEVVRMLRALAPLLRIQKKDRDGIPLLNKQGEPVQVRAFEPAIEWNEPMWGLAKERPLLGLRAFGFTVEPDPQREAKAIDTPFRKLSVSRASACDSPLALHR